MEFLAGGRHVDDNEEVDSASVQPATRGYGFFSSPRSDLVASRCLTCPKASTSIPLKLTRSYARVSSISLLRSYSALSSGNGAATREIRFAARRGVLGYLSTAQRGTLGQRVGSSRSKFPVFEFSSWPSRRPISTTLERPYVRSITPFVSPRETKSAWP
ncbi:hypothetical protein KM043_006116 [Ampulex compressa]|nr:hypothetical protein KM043_006116 [Ampulex compressa]